MTSLTSPSYFILALLKVYLLPPGAGWGTPYNGLYGEVPWLPPDRDRDFSKRSTLKGKENYHCLVLKKKKTKEINNRCILRLLKSHKYLLALQKIVHLRRLEGVSLVNRRYAKGVPFQSKMV